MPSRVFELAAEQCHCVVAVPEQGEQRLPVTQVGDQGCVVQTTAAFKANEYIDITLDFAGVGKAPMFAHVVHSGDGTLELRWLHFDPGEAQRLDQTLNEFQNVHALKAAGNAAQADSAAKADSTAQAVGESAAPVAAKSGSSPDNAESQSVTRGVPQSPKKSTRRVVKPREGATPVAIDSVEEAASQTKSVHKKRRMIRPSSADDVEALFPSDEPPPEADPTVSPKHTTTITPFGDKSEQAPPKRTKRRVIAPSSGAASAAPSDAQALGDDPSRTVRALTKSAAARSAAQPVEEDLGDLAPSEAGMGTSNRTAIDGAAPPAANDESGARHVVLEATANFKQLPDQHTGTVRRTASKAASKPGSKSSGQSQTVRRNIRGQDGKLDVGASIRSRSKTVRASELAARHDKVRVLNMSTIKELIQDAVAEALQRMGGSLDAAERKRLLEEAEEEFQERLKAFNAEKEGWDAQRKNLESQLDRAQRMLQEEKNKEIQADQFTMSAAGLEDLEKRFERLLSSAISADNVSDGMANELRSMVSSVLDSERERMADHARNAQNEAINLLERKISRLAGSLEESERERDRAKRHAAALEAAGGGVAGQAVFSEFEDEDDKQRKLELLRVVFEQNKEMRDQLKSKGVVIKPRKKVALPPPLDAQDDAAASADAPTGTSDPEVEPELADPVAAEAAPADDPESDPDSYDNMVDPDDMPWQPGVKFQTDVLGDNEDDEPETGGVKKITAVKQSAPPPINVVKADGSSAGTIGSDSSSKSAAETDSTVAEDAEDVEGYDNLVDPDDMPWQLGTKINTEIAGDNEDEAETGGVKKIAAYKDIEPPPITIRKAED